MLLIDVNALIEESESGGWDVDIEELRMILKYVPTIDAMPVVRGEWVKKSSEEAETLALCSKCSYPILWWHKTNYCPNCGARMDVRSMSKLKACPYDAQSIQDCQVCMSDAPHAYCCKLECGEHEFCRGCTWSRTRRESRSGA